MDSSRLKIKDLGQQCYGSLVFKLVAKSKNYVAKAKKDIVKILLTDGDEFIETVEWVCS